ncbi:MAG: CCA tRNA nucleotidyltransferase [Euryarchaeota archaeon]|jgi:tRNA nucleotidyltransferase (CCA-adding enzyme)|nr:CCA tRNA nucleotidyltransferase [Euryarchaeota archaeon]
MIPGSEQIETIVAKKITPTSEEKKQIEDIIKSLKKQVMSEIKKTKIPITIKLVGSIAKDTFIRISVDIDLFLLFPPTVPRETLEKEGLFIGRAILEEQEECFAEHPYVRGMFKGYKTELVPCYKIETASQKLSAVDRTPLHTQYIKAHLKESQKKDVRLFKQFLKGISCYGAEAEIEGFSGYLCEIMVLKYGTFQQLIEQVQQWKYGMKLAIEEGVYPDFSNPLSFIDPVDSERNVASAVSNEKFNLLIQACQEYKKNPRLTFFFPNELRPWSVQEIKKEIRTKDYIGVRFPKPEIISENLYPQIRKAVRVIRELCEQYGFTVVNATFAVEKKNVYIILQPKARIISKTVLHTGPPVALKKNADEFLKKWFDNPRTIKKPYEENKRLYVEIEREFTDIRQLLEDQVRRLSLGKNIDLDILKDLTVVDIDDLLIEDLRLFWTSYLDQRMSWER